MTYDQIRNLFHNVVCRNIILDVFCDYTSKTVYFGCIDKKRNTYKFNSFRFRENVTRKEVIETVGDWLRTI